MRAYNKKRKPKHWVTCCWKRLNDIHSTRYALYLVGKRRPKKQPYPKRRYSYCNGNYNTKILSWGVKLDERN